jgi:regulator of chromosome condensation
LFGFLYDSIHDKNRPQKHELCQSTPALIPGLADIKELSCGANHVLALTHSGNVYAWGSGEQGELGRRLLHRHRFQALVPQPVGLPKNKIKQIFAGFHHNFAIDKSGKVYTWGLNNFGQAGIPADEEALTVPAPTIVKSLEPFRIRDISGGSHHSIACTEDGKVLVWGRCDDCQTGISIDNISRDHLVFDSARRPRILNVPTVIPGEYASYIVSSNLH